MYSGALRMTCLDSWGHKEHIFYLTFLFTVINGGSVCDLDSYWNWSVVRHQNDWFKKKKNRISIFWSMYVGMGWVVGVGNGHGPSCLQKFFLLNRKKNPVDDWLTDAFNCRREYKEAWLSAPLTHSQMQHRWNATRQCSNMRNQAPMTEFFSHQ